MSGVGIGGMGRQHISHYNMESSAKSSRSSHTQQLEAEFLALLVNDVGEGVFRDCGKEQFEDLQEDKGGEEFYLEEDEQQQVKGIKTAQFNKFLNMGIQKTSSEPQIELDALTVDSYNFAYGCNEGKTVELIQGRFCRAIGVNIFLENFIYPCQADRNDLNFHSYEICYLSYDSNSQLLYSGSNGRNSEIIEWRYQANTHPALSFVRKVALPASTLGVGFTFKLSGQLFCVTKWSLHKQAELFGFDLESTKKVRYDVALGKVMGLVEALDVYLINQKGLHMLAESEKGFELVKIRQSEQFPTALDKLGSEYLVVGHIDGCVEIVCLKSRNVIGKFAVAKSPILAVKMVGKYRFAASTSAKEVIVFDMDNKSLKHQTVDIIKMGEITRNILACHNGFTCCLKGGKMQSFEHLGSGKISRTTDNIQNCMSLGFSQQLSQRVIYNKIANKYVYYTSGNESVTVFQIDQGSKISKANSLSLSYPISLLDSHGTIIAAIGELPKQKNSTDPSKQILEFYDLITLKSIHTLKQLPFSECSCLKFSEDGGKLALGFANGKIAILNTNICKDTKEICRAQAEKAKDLNHESAIETIIWSNDGKYLKTLSRSNLLFFGIAKGNDDAYQMSVYDGKKTSDKQAMKIGLSKAEWSAMGKFSWRTGRIWSRANSVDQYVEIVESGDYLFASLDSGDMEVFSNPAGEEYHALCRWFTSPYRTILAERKGKEGTVLLIAGKGTLLSVNVR